MPYTFSPAPDPMAVAEQAYSKDPTIQFTPFTSCIGLLANYKDINRNDVTAVHLVIVSDDATTFNEEAAKNAVALLEDYDQVVVIGATDIWHDNVPLPYQYLLSLLNQPIVVQRGDGIYAGRIDEGRFQVYDNGHYINVPPNGTARK